MVSEKAIYVVASIGALMMGVEAIIGGFQVALLNVPTSFINTFYGAALVVIGVIFFVAGGYLLLGELGIIGTKKPT